MSLTEENFESLKSMIYSRYKDNPSMETLADLEYIVNEYMLDGDITFQQCQHLRAIIADMKRPSNHAKHGKTGKKRVKEINKEYQERILQLKESHESKLKREKEEMNNKILKYLGKKKSKKS